MPPDPDPNTGPEEPRTFTQDQVNAFVAEEKRKLTEKFADYDTLKTKAVEFDKASEASKTEAQKLVDALATATAERDALKVEKERTAWAAEIVKGSAVPASVLRGSTREEMAAHFEDLKAILTTERPKRTPVPPGKPSGDGKPGSRAVAALREMRGA